MGMFKHLQLKKKTNLRLFARNLSLNIFNEYDEVSQITKKTARKLSKYVNKVSQKR